MVSTLAEEPAAVPLTKPFLASVVLAFGSLGTRSYIIVVSLSIGQLTLTRPIPVLKSFLNAKEVKQICNAGLVFSGPKLLGK